MNKSNTARSKMATRLRQAVIAATVIDAKKNKKDESYITQLLEDNVKQYDLRMVIFGAFYRVGFDLHELNFEEKQYMESIQLYPYFKNGEIWSDIREELEDMVSFYFNIDSIYRTANPSVTMNTGWRRWLKKPKSKQFRLQLYRQSCMKKVKC